MSSHQTQILLADKLVDAVAQSLTAAGGKVHNNPKLTSDDLPDALKGIHILVVRSTRVTAEALESADDLSLVIRAGAGFNTIDVETASALGIQVANCPGKNAAAVAELAIGLLISCDRQIVNACSELRAGKWRKKEYGNSYGLKGRTLGLLGFGAIGKAVASAAQGLEMNVVAWSRSLTDEIALQYGIRRAASPHSLAEVSDAISVHLAQALETKHIVNRDFLALLRPGAILVNTSRGGLVDTSALRAAIVEKQLRVGIDVFEEEPEGGEAVFSDTALATMLTATPHIGASTAQTSEAIGNAVVEIIENFLRTGHALGAVNLCAKSGATSRLIVRHYNRVGVLASVLDALRAENINVEEMENTILEGGQAAVCSLSLDDPPSAALVKTLADHAAILQISLSDE